MNRGKLSTIIVLLLIGSITMFIVYGLALYGFSSGSNGFPPLIIIVIIGSIIYALYKRAKRIQSYKRYQSPNKPKDIFEKQEEEFKKETLENSRKKQSISKKHDYSHRCPNCKTLISGNERVCPECGTIQERTQVCPKCGHVNPASKVLCENCNEFLI